MTSTRTRRCNATHLGCTCTDQTAHEAWVATNTERVRGTQLRDGDTVFLAGRWQALTDISPEDEGKSFRATVNGDRMFGNALSMYAVAAR